MKLVSFVANGRSSCGVVKDQGVIDLARRLSGRGLSTLRQLLAGNAVVEATKLATCETPDFQLKDLMLAPVITDPDKIICVGMNYRDHVAEVGGTVTEKPSLFARFAGSQVGHLQPMIKPTVSEQFDSGVSP